MLEALLRRAPSVPWTRDAVEGRRQAIAAAHARGASGVETVTALTALADDILRDLYALEYAGTFSPAGVVLVALGGYGRRELAPYSDIDLMFLYEPLHEREARAVSAAILHVLWDLGFQVGHSVRTIVDCRSLGRTDFTIRTALMEARWLATSPSLTSSHARIANRSRGKGCRTTWPTSWGNVNWNMGSTGPPTSCWSQTSKRVEAG